MHTCHILLVEADNAEEALTYVRSQLSGEMPYPTWSDWHEVGGRWSGMFDGWDDTKDVLGYTDNPTLAEDIIKNFADYRLAEIKRYKEQLDEEGFSLDKVIAEYDINDNKANFANGMKLWRMQKIMQTLQDDWTSDSGVFDLQEGTASLTYFKERLTARPEKQFLVPVDFHF
jgi:hypothetical protein